MLADGRLHLSQIFLQGRLKRAQRGQTARNVIVRVRSVAGSRPRRLRAAGNASRLIHEIYLWLKY